MSGMSKAELYMRKFGWEPGMVLGKNQEGLKKPLTVEKKDDNLGVGFTRTGKTFEWWANVYNNAASATKIEKPKTVFNDAFHTGGVQHTLDEPVVAPSEPSGKKHNEEKLFEECEGRTLRAHKPTGKLARLAEQDKAFKSKKRAKDTEENSERGGSDEAPPAAEEAVEEASKKEKKHKKDKAEKKEKKEKRRKERKAKEEEEEKDD